jgi:murein DD-endopeptidase MepM/ murein hydrolase activator NlpD
VNHLPTRSHRLGVPFGLRAPLVLGFAALVASCILGLLIMLAPAAGAASPQPWSWPLGGQASVVRGFELPTEPWMAGHRGVDLLASPGEAVRAAGAGTVTFAGWVAGTPAVAVTHPDGLRTTYEPVLAVVTRGAVVARGTILGRVSVGGSHCLPLACLHWGLRRADSYLDPLTLVAADLAVRLLPVWSDSASLQTLSPVSSPNSSLMAARAAGSGSSGRSSSSRWPAVRLGALNRARAAPWRRW